MSLDISSLFKLDKELGELADNNSPDIFYCEEELFHRAFFLKHVLRKAREYNLRELIIYYRAIGLFSLESGQCIEEIKSQCLSGMDESDPLYREVQSFNPVLDLIPELESFIRRGCKLYIVIDPDKEGNIKYYQSFQNILDQASVRRIRNTLYTNSFIICGNMGYQDITENGNVGLCSFNNPSTCMVMYQYFRNMMDVAKSWGLEV